MSRPKGTTKDNNKVQRGIRLAPDINSRLDAAARKLGCNIIVIVEAALRTYLRKYFKDEEDK